MQMDLYTEIQSLVRKLEISIKTLRKSGTAYAEAERAYKITLRHEALKLRDEGMAVGMISLTVYGVQAVADARFNRDVAEAVYTANKEAILATKLEIKVLENQLAREWGADLSE